MAASGIEELKETLLDVASYRLHSGSERILAALAYAHLTDRESLPPTTRDLIVQGLRGMSSSDVRVRGAVTTK